ncbi:MULTISPECIES: hypothetical protein [unclassified Brenneria]|uniref:hypothetical protein n=1 Tax=unclassified Brenneria TaxID=2634434 RepID=UPI0015550734|nr:hypothetical protein [Brenneria sp. hezel4-2-4]MEE3651054.1 hypothetical protein [Brenneria sp. HEZEL_4_2_4]NPD01009.1 hypothetical protein [Brenneria sp. hezel4-2-4]
MKLGIIGQITRQITRMALEELKDILVLNRNFYLSINLDINDVLEIEFQSYLDELVEPPGEQCPNSVGQGWYFDKPMNGENFKDYYHEKTIDKFRCRCVCLFHYDLNALPGN